MNSFPYRSDIIVTSNPCLSSHLWFQIFFSTAPIIHSSSTGRHCAPFVLPEFFFFFLSGRAGSADGQLMDAGMRHPQSHHAATKVHWVSACIDQRGKTWLKAETDKHISTARTGLSITHLYPPPPTIAAEGIFRSVDTYTCLSIYYFRDFCLQVRVKHSRCCWNGTAWQSLTGTISMSWCGLSGT